MIYLMPNQINAINSMNSKPVGIVCAPTGTGKTVIIYGHIKSIIENSENQHNFIISGPIQDLNEQTASSMLSNLYNDNIISPENCDIVIANCKNRKCNTFYVIKTPENKLKLVEKIDGNVVIDFKVNTIDVKQETKYRITVVCNPTLQNDKKFLDKLNSDIINHFYFDECHTLKNEPINKPTNEDVVEKDYVNYTKIFSMVKNNNGSCHFISATPSKDNFEALIQNRFAITYNDCFSFRLTPMQAINSRMIVQPQFTIIKNSKLEVNTILNTINVIVNDVHDIKNDNKEYIARILVTVNSSDDLDYVERKLLERYGDEFDVFSTCCEYGKRKNLKPLSQNIIEFKEKIETNTRSCFIVHIRQIIAGIDIPSFTHAVFNMESNTNFITPIQITGRVLRPENRFANGEADFTSKKYGFVYVNIQDCENKAEKAARTLTDYYGEIFEFLKPDFFSNYHSGSKTRHKSEGKNSEDGIESKLFDEYISEYLKYIAINYYEFKSMGIKRDIKNSIEETICGRAYVEDLPIFYVPELTKYVNKVKDYVKQIDNFVKVFGCIDNEKWKQALN